MAESVGVSFVGENDFQKEGKWYFLSENSQWEVPVCSTVSSDINDSLAGISDFSEDIVSETASDSGGISRTMGGLMRMSDIIAS